MIVQACYRVAPTPWKVREKPRPSPPAEAPNRPSGSSHTPIITAFAIPFNRRIWGPTGGITTNPARYETLGEAGG